MFNKKDEKTDNDYIDREFSPIEVTEKVRELNNCLNEAGGSVTLAAKKYLEKQRKNKK